MKKLLVYISITICFALIQGCASKATDEKVIKIANLPDNFRNTAQMNNDAFKNSTDEMNSEADILQVISKMFCDEELENLMNLALKNNPDVLTLASKIRQARSQVAIAGADIYPTLSVDGTYSYSGGNFVKTNGSDNHSIKLQGTLSWEADLFGKLDAEQKGAVEMLKASEQDLIAGRVALLADVASYYFKIRSSFAKIDTLKEIVKNYEELLAIYEAKFELGLIKASALLKAHNDYLSAFNSLKNAETETEKNENALLTLINKNEINFDKNTKYVMPKPTLEGLETIPASAILNRSDVASAIDTLNAQIYRTYSKKTALYPSLKISGSIGEVVASTTGAGDLIWQIAGSLSAPLLNRKNITENLNIQKETEKQAELSLNKIVHTALEEIENAAFSVLKSNEIEKNTALLYKNALDNFNIVLNNFNYGLTDTVELLESKNEVLNTASSLNSDELNVIISSIALYKAFGGGFGRTLKMVKNEIDY